MATAAAAVLAVVLVDPPDETVRQVPADTVAPLPATTVPATPASSVGDDGRRHRTIEHVDIHIDDHLTDLDHGPAGAPGVPGRHPARRVAAIVGCPGTFGDLDAVVPTQMGTIVGVACRDDFAVVATAAPTRMVRATS